MSDNLFQRKLHDHFGIIRLKINVLLIKSYPQKNALEEADLILKVKRQSNKSCHLCKFKYEISRNGTTL